MTDPNVPAGYPAQPPAYPVAPVNPGKGLGIAGLILAFFIPLLGLILSIVGKSQSKKAGLPNGPATAGIWLSIIFIVLGIIGTILFFSMFASLFTACSDLGPGVHNVGGWTVTCGG